MQKHQELSGRVIAQYFASFAYVLCNNSPTVTLLLLVVKESRVAVWLLKALERCPTQSLSGIVFSLGIAKDFVTLPCRWPELGAGWAVVAMAGVPIPADFPGVTKLSS